MISHPLPYPLPTSALPATGLPSVAVVIATRGRAAEMCVLLEGLARSTLRPVSIVIVGSEPADWVGSERSLLAPVTLVSVEPGLPRQRNTGIRYLLRGAAPRPDIIIFFDDDFRPHPKWLERAAILFSAHDDIVGLTGIVLRDGAKTAAVPEDEASDLIAHWMPSDEVRSVPRLYGCNMAVRTAVFDYATFDERLPLYGWLEDLDFSGQLSGRLVQAQGCGGVHLGSKGARVSGRRYGYSQVVNPVYLAAKGTCPKVLAARLIVQALVSNSLRAVCSHPIVDYRGRLMGNLEALIAIARGGASPEKITEM